MRIVLNTRIEDAVGLYVIRGLHRRLRANGVDATLNDWDNYELYDAALLLGYDEDLPEQMATARAANPKLRLGLADPKQSRPEWLEAARRADFLLVSSVEQRDVFLRTNRNTAVLFVFPDVPAVTRRHANEERIVVGYHGNRVHLEAMEGGPQLALTELGRRHRVEFRAFYDVADLGRAELGLPDPDVVPTRHIQWTHDRWERGPWDELDEVDIGLVPNELPIDDRLGTLERSAYSEGRFVYEPFDHLVRYKASTGPGRIYPFARRGIPVVTDFAPSSSQFVDDGRSGFVASSPNAWFEALDALARSADLRSRLAGELQRRVDGVLGAQDEMFLRLCSEPLLGEPPHFAGRPSAAEELARLGVYARRRPPLWRRAATRLRR